MHLHLQIKWKKKKHNTVINLKLTICCWMPVFISQHWAYQDERWKEIWKTVVPALVRVGGLGHPHGFWERCEKEGEVRLKRLQMVCGFALVLCMHLIFVVQMDLFHFVSVCVCVFEYEWRGQRVDSPDGITFQPQIESLVINLWTWTREWLTGGILSGEEFKKEISALKTTFIIFNMKMERWKNMSWIWAFNYFLYLLRKQRVNQGGKLLQGFWMTSMWSTFLKKHSCYCNFQPI